MLDALWFDMRTAEERLRDLCNRFEVLHAPYDENGERVTVAQVEVVADATT